MAQCLNCTAEAGFRVEYPGAVHQVFCNLHLPYDLNEILPDFVVRLTNDIKTVAEEAVAPAKKVSAKKQTTPEAPVAEAVADEAVAEAVAETPAAE